MVGRCGSSVMPKYDRKRKQNISIYMVGTKLGAVLYLNQSSHILSENLRRITEIKICIKLKHLNIPKVFKDNFTVNTK